MSHFFIRVFRLKLPFFVIYLYMERKIILIGKAASGKDFLQMQLVSNGLRPLRQYTTRPKRPTEVGDEYHFVLEEEFDSIVDNLTSVQTFNGWRYGIDINEVFLSDVMIFSPANFFDMKELLDKNKILYTIVYLDVDEDTRRNRLSVRYVGGNSDDSLERRLIADEKDFKFFDNIDWDNNNSGIVRLCNKKEVDVFLQKLLS